MLATVRRFSARLRPPGAGSDAELLGRFVADADEAAFAELVRRHGPMVWGVCRRLAGHHDAEDAFQATFLVLAVKADRVRPAERVGAFLHGAAVFAARKAAQRSRRAGGVNPLRDFPGGETVTHPGSPSGGLHPPLASDELAVLHAEIARLPDRYRLPLVLCHLEGLTRREAAARLGWPEGTVSGRLNRGLAQLRDRLTRCGVGLPAVALVAVPGSLLADTPRLAALVAGGLAPVPARLLPLTPVALPLLPTRVVLLLAVGLVAGTAGLTARPPADPPPAPATRPAPRWVECPQLTRPEAVARVAHAPEGVAVADADGTIVYWTGDPGDDPVLLLKGGAGAGDLKTKSIDRLTYTTDGKWLYRIGNGGRMLSRSPADNPTKGYGVGGGVAMYHDVSPDGQTLLCWFDYSPKGVHLRPNGWDPTPPERRELVHVEFDQDVQRAVMSADGAWVAVALANGTTQMVAREGLAKGTILPAAGDLVFSPDSGRLAVVGADAVTVFAHGTGVKLAALPVKATVVAWHPDGNVLTTGGADGRVRLWDAATGKPGPVLSDHTDAVTAVSFRPDGKRLASGSADKTVRVWEFRR